MGHGAADNAGAVLSIQSYEEDLTMVVNTYMMQQSEWGHFVHVRKRSSSNRDLRAVQQLMRGVELYSVKLKAGKHKTTGIAEYAESLVTDTELLAKAIGKANCETCADVNVAVGAEATKQKWNPVHSRFEQHMKDQDEVTANWLNGKFEEGRIMRDLWRQECMGPNPCMLQSPMPRSSQRLANASIFSLGRRGRD